MSQGKLYRIVPANTKQKRFLESTKDEILYSGAVGAGKSFMGCSKGLMLNLRYPGNWGLIVRKEYSALKATTLRTLTNDVLPKDWVIAHKKTDHEIIHRTGQYDSDGNEIYSHIFYFGMDKRADQDYPTKILSSQFGWIFVDEGIELTQEDWDVLATRLRFKIPHLSDEENDKVVRQMWTATNPDNEFHWMHEHFINPNPKKFENEEHYQDVMNSREVIYTNPYENPYLPETYVKKLERTLFGITRRRLLYGEWVGSEGVVYPSFRPEKQVIGDELSADDGGFLEMHSYKEFIFAADSNYPKPRACVLLGLRGDRVDVLDEFYEEYAQVEDLREWIAHKCEVLGRKVPKRGFHDPSDPEAIKKLSAGKVHFMKAKNAVLPGIAEVDALFTQDRIRIHERCHNLIKELQTYKWDKNTQSKDSKGNIIGEKPDKSQPDHACDALRYGIFSVLGKPSYKPVHA